VQNTEDEVLKAAIAKYGKNQWYVALLFVLRNLTLFQGAYIVAARPQNAKAVQGPLV